MCYFCTYFDRNYLVRGLTLFRSLMNHAEPFVLWVLCFDDFTYQVLSKINMPNLRPISLRELEASQFVHLQGVGGPSTPCHRLG